VHHFLLEGAFFRTCSGDHSVATGGGSFATLATRDSPDAPQHICWT
jgi:hypothetical protein